MAKNMTRPGGATPENPARTWGGEPNANTTRQADAQSTGRSVNIPNRTASTVDSTTSTGTGFQDYEGSGYPLGGSYADAKKGKGK